MNPHWHAAVAYLAYATIIVLVGGRRPRRRMILLVLIVSQLPDLIDKPLVYAGVLVSGRSLGHSLITAGLAIILAYAVTKRISAAKDPLSANALAAPPLAVAIGYLSHIFGDAIGPAQAGQLDGLRFLLYPVVSPMKYPSDDISPFVRLLDIYQPLLDTYRQAIVSPELIVITAAVLVGATVEMWHWSRQDAY